MPVTVIVRARLKGEPDEIQQTHDQVTSATREQAQAAGDVSHQVFLGSEDPRDFLGIDVWESVEAFQQFASDPRIQEFFGQLFEGRPEVTIWEDPGWNQW